MPDPWAHLRPELDRIARNIRTAMGDRTCHDAATDWFSDPGTVSRITNGQQVLPACHPGCEAIAADLEPADSPRVAPVARHTDPDTSHDAAESVNKLSGLELQRHILELLSAWPRTDDALYGVITRNGFKVTPSGVRSRRAELVTAGLVWNTGQKRPHPDTGRPCIVWAITADGRNHLNGQ